MKFLAIIQNTDTGTFPVVFIIGVLCVLFILIGSYLSHNSNEREK